MTASTVINALAICTGRFLLFIFGLVVGGINRTGKEADEDDECSDYPPTVSTHIWGHT